MFSQTVRIPLRPPTRGRRIGRNAGPCRAARFCPGRAASPMDGAARAAPSSFEMPAFRPPSGRGRPLSPSVRDRRAIAMGRSVCRGAATGRVSNHEAAFALRDARLRRVPPADDGERFSRRCAGTTAEFSRLGTPDERAGRDIGRTDMGRADIRWTRHAIVATWAGRDMSRADMRWTRHMPGATWAGRKSRRREQTKTDQTKRETKNAHCGAGASPNSYLIRTARRGGSLPSEWCSRRKRPRWALPH